MLENDNLTFIRETDESGEISSNEDLMEISLKDIDDKLKDNPNLSEDQKISLKNLIWKYKNVFEKKPGQVKDFEYNLKITNENPSSLNPILFQ